MGEDIFDSKSAVQKSRVDGRARSWEGWQRVCCRGGDGDAVLKGRDCHDGEGSHVRPEQPGVGVPTGIPIGHFVSHACNRQCTVPVPDRGQHQGNCVNIPPFFCSER